MRRDGLITVLCALAFVRSEKANNSSEVYGRLSANCVDKYNNVFIERAVPRRTYHYFHEDQDRRATEGIVDVQWRIVGGQRIDISEAPFSVLYGEYCGGVIVAPEWVLTAAHCKDSDNYITAGSTKIREGFNNRYSVCAHFFHPLWNAPEKLHYHDYDYQLLLLETPVPVSSRARPIAIGSLSDVVPGAMVSVTGWGYTYANERAMKNTLRQVSVPIIPQNECREFSEMAYKQITPRMFCAGYLNGTRDSCQGDSGGPAVLNNKLIGLVSFGIGCAGVTKPGVYAVVPLARPWIREVTGLPL